MFESIAINLGLDEFTVLQILLVTGVCGFLVSQIVQGWIAPIMCNIGLFFCAGIGNLVCRKLRLVITNSKELDGIVFTSIGLIGGAVLFFAVMLLFSMVNSRVGDTAQKLRERSETAKPTA